MKREDRGGRETGQHHDRLFVRDREAERLAGFERDAMHENAGRAELRDDAVRDVTGPFRGATAQDHHVAFGQGAAHRGFEDFFVVGKRAERDGEAAGLGDGGGHDRAVAVVDTGRFQLLPGLHQFVPGREHGNFRLANDIDGREPAGREHADLARADQCAAAKQGFATRDIGAGIGHELSGRGRAPQFDEQAILVLDQFGLLDHHHGIGAARQHAAGCDRAGGAGQHFDFRRVAAGDHLRIEPEFQRRGVARLRDILRAQGEAVDAGAVEGRNIERGGNVMRQRAAECAVERNGFGREGREIEMRGKALLRFFRRHHLQELLLPRRAADGGEQFGLGLAFVRRVHGSGLAFTLAPAGKPSLSGGTT